MGAEKVIWLPSGIYNDETNEHVDNVCAFTGPATVVLAWTDDESDPQYEMSKACIEVLEKETDVLEFICGFNPKAVSANYELALLYLEKERYNDFYETLLKCRSINGYDWIIESYIKTYEFYKANCLK